MKENTVFCDSVGAVASSRARRLAAVVIAAFCVAVAVGETTYTWDSASPTTSLGDGAVAITLEGGKVSTLLKNASEGVTIDGDSMTFAAGAEVSLAVGELKLALPVAAEGAVTFGAEAALEVYDGQPLSGVSNIVVFSGMTLSEWTPTWCDFNKKNWPGCVFAVQGRGYPYHLTPGEGTLDVQFQALDGSFVKTIKVRFVQEGEDVAARILYTRYITGIAYLGADFDTLEGTSPYRVAIDNIGVHGYDIDYIAMRQVTPELPSVVVENAFSAAGTVTNGATASLVFSGDAAISASGACPYDFYVLGTLGFKNRHSGRFDISGTVSGGAGAALSFLPWDCDLPVVPGDTLCYTGTSMNGTAPYIGTSWNTMATIKGMAPSAITNVTGLIQGPNIATDTDPHVYFVSNSVDGLTRFYQFQTRDGNWFKTIDLEINYVEPLLRVRVPRAQYCSWSNVPGTGDEKFGYILTLDDAKAKGGKDYGVWGYCIHHVNVAFADHDAVFAATSALTGANSILSGRVDVEGSGRVKTCLVVSNAAALPPNGTLNVMSNGIVELAATGLSLYTGYQSGTCKMNVMRGGELRQTAATAVFGADNQRVSVDGGTVVTVTASDKDARTYLQYLDISNGGVVKGPTYPRVGYSKECRWTSSGDLTNKIECGLILTGGNESGGERKFPVVCDGPLAFNGVMIAYNSQLTNLVIEKMGPSKAIQNGRNFMVAPVRIFEGTWVLGASGLVNATKVFELRGGTLELADGVVQDLAQLPILTNGVSGVTLGEGSALSLAEGGLTFVEGARLAVTGPEVKDMHRTGLRVGTTACLPAQTLSKIKYNDRAVCQDREGYILTAGRGTLILFR